MHVPPAVWWSKGAAMQSAHCMPAYVQSSAWRFVTFEISFSKITETITSDGDILVPVRGSDPGSMAYNCS